MRPAAASQGEAYRPVDKDRLKGAKDCVAPLPPALVWPIRERMATAREVYAKDLAAGLVEVCLSYTLEGKRIVGVRKLTPTYEYCGMYEGLFASQTSGTGL